MNDCSLYFCYIKVLSTSLTYVACCSHLEDNIIIVISFLLPVLSAGLKRGRLCLRRNTLKPSSEKRSMKTNDNSVCLIPYIEASSVILDGNVLYLEDSDLELVILLPYPCVGEANVPKT